MITGKWHSDIDDIHGNIKINNGKILITNSVFSGEMTADVGDVDFKDIEQIKKGKFYIHNMLSKIIYVVIKITNNNIRGVYYCSYPVHNGTFNLIK